MRILREYENGGHAYDPKSAKIPLLLARMSDVQMTCKDMNTNSNRDGELYKTLVLPSWLMGNFSGHQDLVEVIKNYRTATSSSR